MTPAQRFEASMALWPDFIAMGGTGDPDPDYPKALFSIKRNGVRSLMMGGQACLLYGATELSRDLDLVIQIDEANLENLKTALA